MAFIGCVSAKTPDAVLTAIEESVKENAHGRLMHLLKGGSVECSDIRRLNLLHLAAWLGYPHCVRLLLDLGVKPDEAHSKNGCTPLHLAHFCTVENTSPKDTVRQLLAAGASVNNPGSSRCGRHPLEHAIQHQRIDSVRVLIDEGASVSLDSVLVAIDVTSPQIVQLLLEAGAQCAKKVRSVLYWGHPLNRVLAAPLKCPRESYKQMFTLFVQATVSRPLMCTPGDEIGDTGSKCCIIAGGNSATQSQQETDSAQVTIENDLRTLAKESRYLALYLYIYLLRNGFKASTAFRTYAQEALCSTEHVTTDQLKWLDGYSSDPLPLGESCMRVVRSYLYLSGNVLYGVKQLKLPRRIQERIIMANPF